MPQWGCGNHGEHFHTHASPGGLPYFREDAQQAGIESNPFCMTLDLQLSFYRSLCYNSRPYCPLLQCLRTTSTILAGAHFNFVISTFKCEWKNSCHDLIPNLHININFFTIYLNYCHLMSKLFPTESKR